GPGQRVSARVMFSRGRLLAFASATIVRRRGFMSGSPPPARAATVSSLIRRVKIFPRLASAAPFLCLIECHLEWPDMSKLQLNQRDGTRNLTTRPWRLDGGRVLGAADQRRGFLASISHVS